MAFPMSISAMAVVACAVFYAIYLASVVIYNIFFHPLRHFPGPAFWTSSRIPWALATFCGQLPFAVAKLHARYGDVVRIAPDELSLIDPSAWKDMMAPHKGRPLMAKDPIATKKNPFGAESIFNAEKDADHSRMKRVLAHAFSEKALREQEPLIQGYVNLLMISLREVAVTGPLNIVSWYELVAFDIVGDLTFGESLECLKNDSNEWITLVNVIFKSLRRVTALKFLPHLVLLALPFVQRTKAFKWRMRSVATTRAMVSKRWATKTDRKDFMFYALRAMERGDPSTMMSKEEIMATFEVLMVAGTETVATLMSGVTYQLLKNPNVLQILVAEIRGAFAHSHEITMVSVNNLKYQLAVLDEALRIMPPVSGSSVRVVPSGEGEVVGGHFVPGGMRVAVPGWAACHSPLNFCDPGSFVPERWLGDSRYADDRREASQPFNIGPRGCIGRNLAYAEMRIILARMLFDFDLELMGSSKLWLENLKNFTMWQKDPMMVRLKPVVRG